jgi:hypothetical protein
MTSIYFPLADADLAQNHTQPFDVIPCLCEGACCVVGSWMRMIVLPVKLHDTTAYMLQQRPVKLGTLCLFCIESWHDVPQHCCMHSLSQTHESILFSLAEGQPALPRILSIACCAHSLHVAHKRVRLLRIASELGGDVTLPQQALKRIHCRGRELRVPATKYCIHGRQPCSAICQRLAIEHPA